MEREIQSTTGDCVRGERGGAPALCEAALIAAAACNATVHATWAYLEGRRCSFRPGGLSWRDTEVNTSMRTVPMEARREWPLSFWQ